MTAISSWIRAAFASYGRSAALIAGLGLTAIAAATTVDGLGLGRMPRDRRVALEPMPAPDFGVGWTPDVVTPTVVRAEASHELQRLLSLTAWAVIAVAGCSMLVI